VNTADKTCIPGSGTVPEAGSYTNAPGTLAVASNCVLLNAVP